MVSRRRANVVGLIPSARRLMTSLRDVGYDFVHAVADLVDNSIAARASRVDVVLRFDGEDSWIRVADNGTGMSGSEITEAMRFGSERDYEIDDLGKFGLGLKTASLSQCRSLIVASRISRESRRIEIREWDLAHVERTNRWEILNLDSSARPREAIQPLQDSTGTVVLWRQLDRILDYRIPWGKTAKTAMLRLAEELDLHLGMVFQRFIQGEARRKKKLTITVNGTLVQGWDPFARDEQHTRRFEEREFEIPTDASTAIVRYQGFILPKKEQFSDLQAFERYSGPKKWNRQQGLYVYRADRLIQSGGWSYLRTIDEHTKFARVAIDFQPDADTAFKINVAKARIILPNTLRDDLRIATESLVAAAKKVYSPPRDSPGSPMQPANAVRRTVATDARSCGKEIEAIAAHIGEVDAMRRIKGAVIQNKPEVADAIGW